MAVEKSAAAKRQSGARLQHVVARRQNSVGQQLGSTEPAPAMLFDEVLVFGQKVDALEHIYQASGRWVYAAVSHGQSFVEALKAANA